MSTPTSTTPTSTGGALYAADVNQAFAAERGQQLRAEADRRADIDARVAAGTLVALGGDRYRISEPGSWDNGETVTLQAGRLIAEHGLDETRGQVALYSSTPAWHALGNIVPGGLTDIDQVLSLGGIDFDVTRSPVLYRTEIDGPARLVPDQYVTVRSDTAAPLGVVGGAYQVLQNREAFEFLQDLTGHYDVVWESAGALRGGRRVFVSLRLPASLRIDAGGVDDEIVPFIVAINSHDGSCLFQVVATPWRPVCGNTERFALRDAHTRWGVRHTRNARDRIVEARRTLGLSQSYYQQFTGEEEALAHTDVAIDEFRRVLDDLWAVPEPGASNRSVASHTRRRDTITGLWETNTARLGQTGYAAERAITEYADWASIIRPRGELRGNNLAARATAVLEGTADDVKARAHRRLLTLTTR